MIGKYLVKEWMPVAWAAIVALKIDWLAADIQLRVLIGVLTVVVLIPRTVKSIVWLIQFFHPKEKK